MGVILDSGVTVIQGVFSFYGQSAVVPVEQLVEHGFPRVDENRRIATALYAGAPPCTPNNRRQREEKENGYWAWADQSLQMTGRLSKAGNPLVGR